MHGILPAPPKIVELLVDHDRRLHALDGARSHRRRDANRHVDELHWPWRTTGEETILDVSASGSMDEAFALLGRAFYLHDVERAHGLPARTRQLAGDGGSRIHDVGYPEQRVLVELDGRLGHDGPEARVKDGARDRRGATAGWLTIRAFWRDVAGHPV